MMVDHPRRWLRDAGAALCIAAVVVTVLWVKSGQSAPIRSSGWCPTSPGSQIVFSSVPESFGTDVNFDLWVVRANGSGLRQITHSPGADYLPSLSSDGRYVVWAQRQHGRFVVMGMRCDGRPVKLASVDGGEVRAPAVSPDGKT